MYPGDKVIFNVCPAATVALAVLKLTYWFAPELEPVFDALAETVTFSVPQAEFWPQTVMAALPGATAETVSVLEDKLAVATPELEFAEILNGPALFEMVTFWLLPAVSERLLGLKVGKETAPDWTFTVRLEQLEAVPTAHRETSDDPMLLPVTATCVPFAEMEATVGAEFESR